MNFIRADQQIMARADLRQLFQFCPPVHGAARVMRVTEEQQAGLRGDCRFKGTEVDQPAALLLNHRYTEVLPSGQRWRGTEGWVDGIGGQGDR